MAEIRKVGRPRNLNSPDELIDLFDRYKQDTKSSPRYRAELTRDGLQQVPLEVPLTMVGFYNYARRRVGEIRQYFLNESGEYKEFLTICRAIREEIEQDQIEGGMVNIYNPSITQRLNGLTDKREETIKTDDNTLRIIVERMDGKK
jgi:hypothetical protein